MLDQAFAAIPEQHGGGGSRPDDIFGTSVTLLQFAETITPHDLTAFYWRTLGNYPGPTGAAWSPNEAAEVDADRQAQLALILSLYDATPNVPKQIMEPVFAYWETQVGENPRRFTDREGTFMAMALTDPQRAADWASRFHAKLDADLRRRTPQPGQIIGRTLTTDRESIGERITRDVYHRWVIE